ncbi:MAG: hypothetical protein IPM55_02450 [Acidobacteria bacterium]|nr:hypothetical protein [Acidobacteriota bacterium]
MRSITDLVTTLTGQGVKIWAEGEKIQIEAPDDILTDEIIETIREHKPALLSLLALPCPSCGNPALIEQGEGWEHRSCSGHYDAWERTPGRRWRDLDARISDIFREALKSEAIQ